jgi:dTDP-4-amino-4,6-dideoxygalactose transaminase
LHHQPAYQSYFGGASFPVSEDLARRVISLPFSADLQATQVASVVRALVQATSEAG